MTPLENDHQREVTADRLRRFREALADLKARPSTDTHPLLVQAERQGIESWIERLSDQLAEYDARKL